MTWPENTAQGSSCTYFRTLITHLFIVWVCCATSRKTDPKPNLIMVVLSIACLSHSTVDSASFSTQGVVLTLKKRHLQDVIAHFVFCCTLSDLRLGGGRGTHDLTYRSHMDVDLAFLLKRDGARGVFAEPVRHRSLARSAVTS